MDLQTTLLASTTGTTIIAVLLWIYRNFNHRRIRSKCCGYNLSASLDIENTTPPSETAFVVNPIGVPATRNLSVVVDK